MNRKIIIVFIFVLLILIVITGALFFISKTEKKPDENILVTKIRDLFPFGKTSISPDSFFEGDSVATQTDDPNINTAGQPVPRLRKIHDRPTSGSKIYSETNSINKEKSYFVRFIERSTGHVNDTAPNSFDIKKISNTTIPKVYETKFITEKNIFNRLLNEESEVIKTYFLTIKEKVGGVQTSTTSTSTITTKESVGNYLENDIRELAISPSGNKIAYSLYTEDGGSIIISNTDGTSRKLIYTSKLREWLLDWQNDQTLIITTKPSGYTAGYSYSLNVNTGNMTKNVGEIVGLTILSKPGTNDSLVGSGGGGLSLSFLRKQGGINSTLFLTRTLPEKCIWSKKDQNLVYCAVPANVPNGVYPDAWYQGNIFFNDSIWRINVSTGQSNIILNPQTEVGKQIDMIHLDISDDDSYLTFIDKNDLSLWGYQIVPPIKNTDFSNATTTQSTTTTQ